MSFRALFGLISGLALLMAIFAGCGRDKVQVLPEAEEPQVRYELAWIDPQIVMGDTLFTLIRAARVDSFVVEGPDTGSAGAAQLVFQVEQPSCFVAVNLVDASGDVYLPVLARNLPSGFYKLSLDGTMLTPVPGIGAPVLMRALVCGREESVLLNPFVGR
ncbi:hypothetical protein GF356_00835 [candidate division GN15 bacterium]|nr:hypothetical protein [candidate division GN15 bacterium]